MLLGCIGDDFTGSSDLANTLAKEGMHAVQYSGVPSSDAPSHVDAGIVALKSRSIPVKEAIAQSLEALEWLKAQGCTQFFFKYCSTFDSTAEGNIGPVAEALAEALGATGVIFCPAFPGTGRSLYQGHLFVNDILLSDSPLRDHPLNPMTESDLRIWLAKQTRGPVGHVGAADVFAGPDAIKAKLAEEVAAGRNLVIMDALRDDDLRAIGTALSDAVLITGGSGVALGLPDNFRRSGAMGKTSHSWQGQAGTCAILCGSCSAATRRQIEVHKQTQPSLVLDAASIIDGQFRVSDAQAWVEACWQDNADSLPLIYSSADPEEVQKTQQMFGTDVAAAALEGFFGALAATLVDTGIGRLIAAGGETSGAVVEHLDIDQLEIGPEIDPGVPALRASPSLTLALKSGNFGAEDFFAKAARQLG
ncbi:MAG: four-carbon acid sugar kinase family protein [Alphaproteobacteria bacterium]|jgi:uncharacterized protein YgbK (DUF1537 family)|nr:four-carbon acid sugar kinase family protein [Alphaproteobacteria bacterium]